MKQQYLLQRIFLMPIILTNPFFVSTDVKLWLSVFSKRVILYAVQGIKLTRSTGGNCNMIEATSCGGVVIYRGKILALYKSYKNRYEGWVLPKGTVEEGETHIQTLITAQCRLHNGLCRYVRAKTHRGKHLDSFYISLCLFFCPA